MFLLFRLLILTWISESELGHINSTQLFCANCFWHAWVWIVPFYSCIDVSLCVWYQMKEEEMLLIMKHIVGFNIAWQRRYLTDKTGFLFCGTHCINGLMKCKQRRIKLRNLSVKYNIDIPGGNFIHYENHHRIMGTHLMHRTNLLTINNWSDKRHSTTNKRDSFVLVCSMNASKWARHITAIAWF